MTAFHSAAQLQHELDSVQSYLTAAQDIVASGHMPDLSGFDKRIAALCNAIQEAHPDMQQQYRTALAAILEQLTACEKSLKTSPFATGSR
ncbi:MAG: hypothetical protein M3N08_08215 [Pseudomonadota bacterium]|nr:hypothetical protein [Pseudomonadota bacterium]